jgi:hypothetical protein
MMTPQLVADLLVVAFFLAEALRWRRQRPPLHRSSRGTTLVFWGCYVITLLALNFTAPSPVTAAPPVAWIGVIAAAGGLARIVATLVAMRSAGAPSRETRRFPESLAYLVFWIGAVTASLHVIAMLTVTVAMAAATGVLLSVETARSRRPPSSRALSGSGE